MGTCYITGAGEPVLRGFAPQPGDLVLAADGGLATLRKAGVQPSILLGDLDSLGDLPLPAELPVLRYPVEKDDTDVGIALQYGWEQGCRDFALYGCGGGRVDHLLANLQLMACYSRMGAQVRLVARDYDAYAITNASLLLPPRPAGTLVSVFCHGERAEGVTLRGLFYPLTDATLTCDMPLGVSNHVLNDDRRTSVSVRRGTLYVLAYTSLC